MFSAELNLALSCLLDKMYRTDVNYDMTWTVQPAHTQRNLHWKCNTYTTLTGFFQNDKLIKSAPLNKVATPVA